jgi:Glycosyltransferase family 87
MHSISRDLATQLDARGARTGQERPGWPTTYPPKLQKARRPLSLIVTAASWLIPIAFLVWAARLVLLEGYVYEISGDFLGDFTRTAALGAPTWFTGQELFYGPIFVLEYRFLVAPNLMSPADFSRLDFVLFGLAFVCTWLALFGAHRPRLAIFALAAWLANHMSVEAFSNTAHLEVLELALIAIGLLLAVRRHLFAAGASLGLAVATKTLPGLFLPYLALTRQWRMLGGASLFAAVPFLAVCWLQGITPWNGLYQLIYQGGNLTKLEYSEYEYTPRAEIARMLVEPGGTLTAQQAELAIGLHWAIAVVAMLLAAWVLSRARIGPPTYGLMFGLVAGVVLLVAPSAHAQYYIFLLPGWTAILAELVSRPISRLTTCLWVALPLAYTFTGFDQPFFLAQRLFGFGIVVPQHWLPWHLPTLGLLLTLISLAVLLLVRPAEQTRPAQPRLAAR